ncbi:GTP-binding protein, partial [Klebsiella pneumoniae]|uniref:GTP-binding protein n=1 Tax=Klebsiella pneumoniae TaxID=573 RepID=UPI00272EF608
MYVDTPGLHMEEKRAINRLMNKAASSSIGDVELVIFVVEGTRCTQDDEMVLNKLRDAKAPVILAVNKVDNAAPVLGVTLAMEEQRANVAEIDDGAINGIKV